MSQLTIEPLDYSLKVATLKQAARASRGARTRVVFLIHAPETFSALELVVEELQARSDRFELIFCAIPRNYSGTRGEYEGAAANAAFLAERGLDPITLHGQTIEDLITLIHLAPDFIFRQSPWDRHIPTVFGSGMLRFSQLCYVPYGLMMVEKPERQYNQPFHNACEFIFCESDFHLALFGQYRQLKQIGVHMTGYPRFDALVRELEKEQQAPWPIAKAPDDVPRVIWAPHHTVEGKWLAMSTFPEHYARVLAEAQQGRLSILVRPHPALGDKLEAHGIMSRADYAAWCDAIDATPYSAIDRAVDYLASFAASDLLITDGVGFFADYLLTGKPLVRTLREGAQALNAFGSWLVEACRDVRDGDALETVFDEIAERRYVDPHQALREERRTLLQSLGEGAATRIVDLLERR